MTPIEYDESYYRNVDGKCHPAGYSSYNRLYIADGGDPDCQGEEFKTHNYKIFKMFEDDLFGKKTLELGCAKGFMVTDFRIFGVEAYGIDRSEYAVSFKEGSVYDYVNQADVRTDMDDYIPLQFDVVIANRILPCLTDLELAVVIPKMLLCAQKRIVIVDDYDSYPDDETREIVSEYYNVKTKEAWQLLCPGCDIVATSELSWLQQ